MRNIRKNVLQGMLAAVAWLLFSIAIPVHAQERRGSDFDHLRTGFALSGAHARAECQSCHASGIFKGTPSQCALCHIQGNRMGASAKPTNHVQTAQPCEQCHTSTVTWVGARFQHTGIGPGSCATCHNGSTATGKPANHVQTTSPCDTCHRTTAWVPAGFNHVGVVPGSCATCHNGSTATGKPANHVQTTSPCDTCHRTTAWVPASFSHASVAPNSCPTCHNGSTATGKPARHVVTTASCDQCHRTTAWLPATFSHVGVAPNSCNSCHGVSATGKPSSHMVTARSCDACHTTTAWLPVRYTHVGAGYVAHRAGTSCRGCHTTNNETITWRYAAYAPQCAGCHAGDFKSDPHKKTETPTTIRYTVDELRNCSGSCHIYTDNTFTTIRTTRNSKHRSTDGGF